MVIAVLKLHGLTVRIRRYRTCEETLLDEIYRGYRIAIKAAEGAWTSRVWTTRGALSPLGAKSTAEEGSTTCLARARSAIDRYLDYIGPQED